MANTPNLNLPQQSNWTSGLVKDWAKSINDENDANNAFKKIDDFAGNTNTALNGKEASANKQTSIPASPDDTHYPSSKAVKEYVDAHGGAEVSAVLTGTLSVAGWSGNAQTLTISGLAVSGYAYTVAPASASFNDYTAAVIYADDITTANKITFHCKNVPTSAISIRIMKVQVQ